MGTICRSLSSPPVSETQTPEPPRAVENTTQMDENGDSLFVTPAPKRPTRISSDSKNSTKVIMTLNGVEADEEKQRRIDRYRVQYEAHVDDMSNRHRLRKYAETRNRIWKQSMEKAQARVEEIGREMEDLVQKIVDMSFAQQKFNVENVVVVTSEVDMAIKRKFEEYFNLETDELDVSRLDMEDLNAGERDAEEPNEG